ncbi:MAG: hypothetical protein WA991_03915 [Ornithinimicrobium sp.]
MATGPTTIDTVLTSVSEAYTNDTSSFIAEQLFPVIPTDQRSGKYWAYNKDNLRVPSSTLRTGRSKTHEATFGRELKDWGPLNEHALKDFISVDEYKFTDNPLNPETDLVNFLNEQMLIAQEKDLADVLSDTSVITHNSSPSSAWDTDNGDPFADIVTAIKAQKGSAMKMPNTLSFGWDVWMGLINNPAVKARLGANRDVVVTKELLLALFAPYGIKTILVGDVTINDANEGASDSLASVWGKDALLSYVTPTPGLRTLNGGYTFRLNGGKYVDRWDDADPKGTWIRSNDYYDQFMFNSDMFYLLEDVVG